MSYLDSGRGTHTHTNHIFYLGRVCREQGLPSNSPRGGGPFFVRDTGRVFFSRIGPGRASWNPDHHPNPVPPRPPLKSDFPYPGLLTERLNSESARLFLHGMFRRRAGCVPNSHHCLLLFGLATAISWRSMPCKSAVLKPDMHNGRATAGGGREAGGREFIDLSPHQDSQGCQSSAQVDKGSSTPRLAATATQILMMGSCAQSHR